MQHSKVGNTCLIFVVNRGVDLFVNGVQAAAHRIYRSAVLRFAAPVRAL